ncbi:hypothetical protein HDE_04356 [Halotydeus destructor]|nr:hypothetical protein HDE_04356 [Halotydeus destructor]
MAAVAELKAALSAAGVDKTVPDDLLTAYLVATDNDVSEAVERIQGYMGARQAYPRVAPTMADARKLVNLGLVGTSTNSSGKLVIWHMSGKADPSAISAEEYTRGVLAISELKATESPNGQVFVLDWADFKRPGFIDTLDPGLALDVAQYFVSLPIKVDVKSSFLVNTTPEVKAAFVQQGHLLGEHGVFLGSDPAAILAAVGTTDSGQGQQAALLAELNAQQKALEWRWKELQH